MKSTVSGVAGSKNSPRNRNKMNEYLSGVRVVILSKVI